uniref:Uncharacterized protein n=1 Tax=Oryza sativa subsp. indica TaxID=39946 RepID=Q0P199_ORYSI|nr:hypothetical protein TQB7A1.5 [Oryza sativa Indica Group]
MGWTLMGHGENRSTVVHSWGARIHRHHAVWQAVGLVVDFSERHRGPRIRSGRWRCAGDGWRAVGGKGSIGREVSIKHRAPASFRRRQRFSQRLIYKYMKNGVLNVHFHDGSSMTATQLRRRLC